MFLGGIPVAGGEILVLAKLVKDPRLADKLVDGVRRDAIAIRLDDLERVAILKALSGELPAGLRDLQAKLLAEEDNRQLAGLVPDGP